VGGPFVCLNLKVGLMIRATVVRVKNGARRLCCGLFDYFNVYMR
jgi:hypothetical protein